MIVFVGGLILFVVYIIIGYGWVYGGVGGRRLVCVLFFSLKMVLSINYKWSKNLLIFIKIYFL